MVPGSRRARPFKCPSFPPILEAVNRILDDPRADDRDLRRAVRADEGLSLSLLRYADSAWMARRHRPETVDEALTVVGLAGLRSIVLTEFAAGFFPTWGPVEEFLWEHALASAIAAALQRPGAGRATEDMFLCGLLHNVGKAALNADQRETYRQVIAHVFETGEDFCRAEEAMCGVTHPTVGAELLHDANVPEIVKQATVHHHQPEKASPNVAATCRMLLFTDTLAYRVSTAWKTLRGEAEEPAWLQSRCPVTAPESTVAAAVSSHEELVRLELQRLRLAFRVPG